MIYKNQMSSKGTDEKYVMHSKNDNLEIMKYDRADEVIEELFESFLKISNWCGNISEE